MKWWDKYVDTWDWVGDDPLKATLSFGLWLFVLCLLSYCMVLFIAPLLLLWAWPLWRALDRRGRSQAAMTVKVLAIVINLLCGACWGAFLSIGIGG
jgi:hypothetical protein